MKYLMLIRADGRPAPEELAVMQRELLGWDEEMDGRGVRLPGRELDLPETAATVRVRDGQALVADGPFAKTKEFIAGFDLLECADTDEAIEVAAKCPASWFQTLEIRPFLGGLRLGEEVSAFGCGEDGAASPYLLIMWVGGTPAAVLDNEAVLQDGESWRQDLAARGLHVLGNALQGPDTATTVRVRDGDTLLSRGRAPVPRSSSPASTSSAAPIGSRRSSSRPRIRSPGTTRLRRARSIANDHAPPFSARCSLPRRVGLHRRATASRRLADDVRRKARDRPSAAQSPLRGAAHSRRPARQDP
jgi:hypothetical protein